MRSHWVGRLFGHSGGGSSTAVRLPKRAIAPMAPGQADKPHSPLAVRAVAGGFKRLCLGIGDGDVHRQ